MLGTFRNVDDRSSATISDAASEALRQIQGLDVPETHSESEAGQPTCPASDFIRTFSFKDLREGRQDDGLDGERDFSTATNPRTVVPGENPEKPDGALRDQFTLSPKQGIPFVPEMPFDGTCGCGCLRSSSAMSTE